MADIASPSTAVDASESEPAVSASGTGQSIDSQAVTDLLAVLAYGELTAFERLAQDATLAPTLEGRATLAEMAGREIAHFKRITERLALRGVDPAKAMQPFVPAFETFHATTTPSNWHEGLVKAYVGDGMAADFYREVAEFADPETKALIVEVLADTGTAEFVVREVRAAIADNPALAGRLALWGRRMVGEAISQTQHVLAENDGLTELLVNGTGGLTGVSAMITRITDRHADRMKELGLQ